MKGNPRGDLRGERPKEDDAPKLSSSHAGAGPSKHSLSVRGNDCYETPECAVHALLAAEPLPHVLWEPACGRGAIVNVLRAAGHFVIATDLNDYGCPGSISAVDFLMERQAPPGVEAIISNPPYKNADEFVRKALDLSPIVVMLLRLAFLEGARRSDILEGPLERVLVFKERLPRMHRDGWTGPQASSNTAFAWFVWDRGHTGPAELRRISCRSRAESLFHVKHRT